jgi:hypothetical protein
MADFCWRIGKGGPLLSQASIGGGIQDNERRKWGGEVEREV